MTFVAVSAGQLIKASITNANLRHVGRLGTHLIPMDTAGVGVTDGSQDLGSLTNPHGDAYFKSGAKIYKGATEFVGGGGGGGGLEVLEIKTHLEKTGINYPISKIDGINESFTDTSNVVITPRIAYASGTTFIADFNKTDIDLMEATTGWTGGKTTGTSATLATDTTAGERVQGSASNKLTIVAVSDLAWMIKDQTAFSLVDQVVTLSMYLDNLPAAFTKASIRLSSTAGGATNYKQYDIIKANLVAGAGTFNHISIDPNNDTADSSNGTYLIESTIAVNIYFTFTSSSTMLAAVDFIVRQPNWLLPLPMSYYIWDATNQERIAIASVTGTGYHQRRTYTITALSNAYAVDAAYAKERNITISGGRGVFPSGGAGAVALACYDQTTEWFNDTVADKTLNMSQRFWDEEYKITALTSTTETKIYSATDLKAHFLSGDKVILYNKTFTGRKYHSIYNATVGSNFKLVTLTSNASYSGTDILLTHATAGDENTGMSVGNWYAVRYSAEMLYKLEATNAAGELSTLPPTVFFPDGNNTPLFSDGFDGADGVPGNNWSTVADDASYTTLPTVSSNRLKLTGVNVTANARCYRNLENYSYASSGYEVTGDFQYDATGADANRAHYVAMCAANTANMLDTGGATEPVGVATSGTMIRFHTKGNTLKIYNNATEVASVVFNFGATSGSYKFRLKFNASYCKVKCWAYADAEPTTWSLEYKGKLTGSGNYMFLAMQFSNTSTTNNYFDNIKISNISGGYVARGSVVSLSGAKLTTATKLTRSAAAQNPIIYQREAEVV